MVLRKRETDASGICHFSSSSHTQSTSSSSPLPLVTSFIITRIRAYIVILILLISIDDARASSKYLNHVTCGSVVKLVNANFLSKLHSHDVKYGSGSGQQSVTGNDEADDGNSYWQVKGSTDGVCTRGSPVKCGDSLRLTHLATGKNLHSHLFSSPLSAEQEVSAFGNDGEGDTGDNWTVVCATDVWQRDETVKFKHVDTERFLTMTGRTYGRPISGQIEVVGTKYPDASAYWKTVDGVYVKPDDGSAFSNSLHDEL
jgi:dolichyl-phosphate-mannose--protein O-mannosyl transferase